MKPLLSIIISLLFILNNFANSKEYATLHYNCIKEVPKKIIAPFDSYITADMLSQLVELTKRKGNITLFCLKEESLASINGSFDVFVWENNNWTNLYKGKLGGYNLGGYKFIYNDELYSFGGYGYWEYNNKLIKFNRDIEDWVFVAELDSKDAIIGPFCWVKDNQFIVTGGSFIHESGKNLPNSYEYRIDLDTKLGTKSVSKYSHLAEITGHQDLSNLFLSSLLLNNSRDGNNFYSNIYNIEDQKYYRNELKIPLFHNVTLLLNDKENLFFYNTDSTVKQINEVDLLKSATLIGNITKGLEIEYTDSESTINILLIFLISAIGYIYFKKQKRKQSIQLTEVKESVDQSNSDQELEGIAKQFETLTAVENSVITPDTLHELLEIDKLDMDSQRARRSQLIKSINLYAFENLGYNYIHRVKEENDKRYVTYWIGNPTKQAL